MKALAVDSENLPLVTTVGDLVSAVVDAALESVADERAAYRVAGLVLNNLLRLSSGGSLLLDEPDPRRVRDA